MDNQRNQNQNQNERNQSRKQSQNENLDSRSSGTSTAQTKQSSGNAQGNQKRQLNAQEREQQWGNIKKSYRQKYPNLTEEDVSYRSGEFDNMTQRVAQKTNRSRDQVNQEIDTWNDKRQNRNEEE